MLGGGELELRGGRRRAACRGCLLGQELAAEAKRLLLAGALRRLAVLRLARRLGRSGLGLELLQALLERLERLRLRLILRLERGDLRVRGELEVRELLPRLRDEGGGDREGLGVLPAARQRRDRRARRPLERVDALLVLAQERHEDVEHRGRRAVLGEAVRHDRVDGGERLDGRLVPRRHHAEDGLEERDRREEVARDRELRHRGCGLGGDRRHRQVLELLVRARQRLEGEGVAALVEEPHRLDGLHERLGLGVRPHVLLRAQLLLGCAHYRRAHLHRYRRYLR